MNTATISRKLVLAATLFAASGLALAAEPKSEPFDVGKAEYQASCAVCHGMKGKGDGPMRSQLVKPVPDITLLARHNHGVFPFNRVYQIIDGREQVLAHGPREMPVWGRVFSRQSSIYFENYPMMDAESAARSRIMALTEYVYRLQAE
jgi:mono/diheme cytochrome c family protein